jgi:hypothetical protein
MKNIKQYALAMALLAMALGSCSKDNYDAPESTLSGRVVYNGEALQLRGNQAVQLQLYQRGYAKHDPISVYVNQDGGYSARLFDGQYQLITRNGNGPWSPQGRDTIEVQVVGSTIQDVQVTPYYLVQDAQIALNGNSLDASFTVEKIAGGGIKRFFVALSTTQYANSDEHNVDLYDVHPDFTEYDETGKTYTFPTKDYSGNEMFQTALKRGTLFARIGLTPNGSDESIYSKVVRLR